VGHLAKDLQHELRANPALLTEIAQRLLSSHFPETLHQDILDAVGLSLENSPTARRSRDPQFRNRVLVAYQFQCALCGLDLRIGNMTMALEAAHIKWHQAGGPDTESNGVALCSLHHKIFDLGAFTIHTDYRVLVSELVHGTREFERVLLQHHGRRISPPLRSEDAPFAEYLEWHRREVFKERPRPFVSVTD
jgi:putative restriction endonuclease